MKRKLLFFFICLLMVTIGVGSIVFEANKHIIRPSGMSALAWERYSRGGGPFYYTDDNMRIYAGLITFGIGAMIGVPLIIRSERRRND